MLRTGTLDRRIAIQRNTPTLDIDGQPIDSWATIGLSRWASRSFIDADERFASDQFIAREQTVFIVRWTSDLSDVNPKDRIVFPVSSSPTDSEIYDVIEVQEVGWREALRIMAARRTEI